MPDLNKMCQYAVSIAENDWYGYDQPRRMSGRDTDCSELVRKSAKAGGFSVPSYMWTGNEIQELTRRGWSWHPGTAGVRRGDILWKPGHTAIHLGNNTRVEAWMNEFGGASGGRPGDQTGQEIRLHSPALDDNFSGYLRYAGQTSSSSKPVPKKEENDMATHVIFTINNKAVAVGHMGAGTYHIFAKPQEYKDAVYALKTAGEKVVTWGALRKQKSNDVGNPAAFGVKI